jgi:hypothetical protein
LRGNLSPDAALLKVATLRKILHEELQAGIVMIKKVVP